MVDHKTNTQIGLPQQDVTTHLHSEKGKYESKEATTIIFIQPHRASDTEELPNFACVLSYRSAYNSLIEWYWGTHVGGSHTILQ